MKQETLDKANGIKGEIDLLEILSQNLSEDNINSVEFKTNKGVSMQVCYDPIDIKKVRKLLNEITDAKLKKARRELARL